MASRARREGESFKAYRSDLEKEARARRQPPLRIFHRSGLSGRRRGVNKAPGSTYHREAKFTTRQLRYVINGGADSVKRKTRLRVPTQSARQARTRMESAQRLAERQVAREAPVTTSAA